MPAPGHQVADAVRLLLEGTAYDEQNEQVLWAVQVGSRLIWRFGSSTFELASFMLGGPEAGSPTSSFFRGPGFRLAQSRQAAGTSCSAWPQASFRL